MSRITPLALALLAALPFAALAQTAATRLDTVDVRGGKATARRDVSTSCPNYGNTLQTELGKRFIDVTKAEEYLVHFQLDGQEISQVGTPYMPMEYRRFVRSAVRTMSCSADAKPNQHFAFVLVVLPEDQSDGRVAVREARDIQLAAVGR